MDDFTNKPEENSADIPTENLTDNQSENNENPAESYREYAAQDNASEAKSTPDNDGSVNGEYHFVPPKDTSNQYGYYNPNNNPNVATGNYQNFNSAQNGCYQEPAYRGGAYGSYRQPEQNQYSNNYYNQPKQPTSSSENAYSANPQPKVTVETPDKPKKKKNKTVVTIVVIVVVCAVLALIGTVVAINGDSSNSDSSDSTSSSSSSSSDSSEGTATVEDSNSAAETDSDGNLTAAGVTKKVIDSCVGISVYTQQDAYSYFNNYSSSGSSGDNETASGTGSGVIMSEANGKTYIMTAAHVISDGSSFTVTLNNDDEYEATLVGYDSQTDIGVLSIEATGLQTATFGDSDDIQVGEACVAIGCPGGLDFKNSVTEGIVSALDRPVESSIGYNNKCIQVDAAINPGNSGGALFNMQGQVIGINSSKIASTDYEGMGFAVPSNTAVETANSLIKNGYVAGRAKLGIQYVSLSNYNNSSSILSALAEKGYKGAQGTMVIQEVDSDSDLANSDIQQYDMIVAVNGETMTSTDILTSILSESSPGDSVTLTIARIQNNSIKTFDVKCKLIESKN